MKARYVKQVGMRGKLRIYWDVLHCVGVRPCDQCPDGHPDTKYGDTCPNSYGTGRPGLHNAYAPLGDKPGATEDFRVFGEAKDYPPEMWPTSCASCGAPVPEAADPRPTKPGESGTFVEHQVFVSRLYDSPSGETEPGDVYKLHYHGPGECPHWDNCEGIHTFGMLPNGHQWDMDGRASNCTMKEERTHRCWVKQGSAEAGTLDVGKAGHTCAAGAGSIAAPGWHGFLRNFDWQG